MVVPTEAAAEDARRNLADMMEQARTQLELSVLVSEDKPALELLHESSRSADLILVGIAAPDQGDFAAYFEQLRERSQLIVITHQKPTMEVADALYGVSMRGDGITTVISQRMRGQELVSSRT